jgi:hypothetical protein
MAAASSIAGGLTLLNCFSSSSRCRRIRSRSVTMAVSTDPKPKTDKLILRKSEEAFAAAKVGWFPFSFFVVFENLSIYLSNGESISFDIRN